MVKTHKKSFNQSVAVKQCFKHKGGPVPIDGMSWLAARVIADLDVALIELHCDMIIVPIIKQDAIVLCC